MAKTETELDAILRVLAAWPAILPLPALPACLEVTQEASTVILRELLDRKLVTLWQSESIGPCVVLTQIGTERLGLELYDPIPAAPRYRGDPPVDGLPSMHWVTEPPPEKAPPPRARGERLETDLAAGNPGMASRGTNAMPDPRPGRPELVEFDPQGVTSPVLLGITLPGWCPEVEQAAPPCPVCHDLPLRWRSVCLGCCRTGMDRTLQSVPPEERPREQYRPSSNGLAGGVGSIPRSRKTPASPPPSDWRRDLIAWRREIRRRPS
jgi:hypothetical protein